MVRKAATWLRALSALGLIWVAVGCGGGGDVAATGANAFVAYELPRHFNPRTLRPPVVERVNVGFCVTGADEGPALLRVLYQLSTIPADLDVWLRDRPAYLRKDILVEVPKTLAPLSGCPENVTPSHVTRNLEIFIGDAVRTGESFTISAVVRAFRQEGQSPPHKLVYLGKDSLVLGTVTVER